MKRSPLVVIFTTVFIDLVGFGIVIPVLPFYAEGTAFNATPRTVGFLRFVFDHATDLLAGAGRFVRQAWTTTGAATLDHRHRHRFSRTRIRKTLFMLFVGRILDGITGGNISTAQAYIADVTTEENRAKGME